MVGVHAYVVGDVAGSSAVDESSDSDAEQEGPQKLIRKVSTSGQLRSKVRHLCFLWGVVGQCLLATALPSDSRRQDCTLGQEFPDTNLLLIPESFVLFYIKP